MIKFTKILFLLNSIFLFNLLYCQPSKPYSFTECVKQRLNQKVNKAIASQEELKIWRMIETLKLRRNLEQGKACCTKKSSEYLSWLDSRIKKLRDNEPSKLPNSNQDKPIDKKLKGKNQKNPEIVRLLQNIKRDDSGAIIIQFR